ncbi:MAG: trypsin-like peptidase domain-containing protein [Nannocystaceae bacterium]
MTSAKLPRMVDQPGRRGPEYPAWMVMGAAVFGVLLGGLAIIVGAPPTAPRPAQPADPRSDLGQNVGPSTPIAPANEGLGAMASGKSAVRSTLVGAVAQTRASVVCLKAHDRLQGAGVVYDPSGTILTNYHVVAPILSASRSSTNGDATAIMVRFGDGRELPARVVITSSEEDVAVLKLHSSDPAEIFPYSHVGSSDKLAVGEHVFAVGCPVGLSQTVSTGIVSALERTDVLPNRALPAIQLDASINLGNSGGPLFDLSGKVVGITTARSREGEGIGFAIPIDRVMALLRAFDRGESSRAAQIQAWLDPQVDPTAEITLAGYTTGITVQRVLDGPAKRAGMRAGDVLVGVRGMRYDDFGATKWGRAAILKRFIEQVRALIPGERLEVRVVRNQKVVQLDIEAEAVSAQTQARLDASALLGLKLAKGSENARVVGIVPGSAIAGHRGSGRFVGAEITHVLGHPVSDLETLGETLHEVKKWARHRSTVAIDFRGKSGERWQTQGFPLTLIE